MKHQTKLLRAYKKNWLRLVELKRLLSETWGRQASFADVINFLIRFYDDKK